MTSIPAKKPSAKAPKPAGMPAQLNARTHTQGADSPLASGPEGHLPHEAWHVVQQTQGRVNATVQRKTGTAINDDKARESSADAMGAIALKRTASSKTKVVRRAI